MINQKINALANAAAAELGDRAVSRRHFVLAILHPEVTSVASDALRACGADYQTLAQELRRIPSSTDSAADDVESNQRAAIGRPVSGDGLRFLGRAEGIAAGMGAGTPQPEHYLLSLLWDDVASDADRALNSLGASRTRIVEEFTRLGGTLPPGRVPRRILWGPFRPVSSAEYEEASAQFTREGVHYRMGYKGDQILLAVAEGWEEP